MTRSQPSRCKPTPPLAKVAQRQISQPSIIPCRGALSTLEKLPDAILERIFAHLVNLNPENLQEFQSQMYPLFISRRLLPFAIETFYYSIAIRTQLHCVRLYATLKRRPGLGRFVRYFRLRINKREALDEGGTVAEKSVGMSRSARRKMRHEDTLEGILPEVEAPHDPSRYTFCGDLLRRLMQQLPNVVQLVLYTKCLFSALFSSRARPPFQNLRNLTFCFRIPEELAARYKSASASTLMQFEVDFDAQEHRDICAALSRLPSLQELTFVGNREFMPCATAVHPSSIELRPQSWPLKAFFLREMNIVKDLSTVFSSFTESFTTLVIQAKVFATTLQADLFLLPASLTRLALTSGPLHCGLGRPPLPLYPTIDEALLLLTNLETLELSGPLISSSFWTRAHRLSNLKHLLVGYHLPQNGPAILALIDGPEKLENLISMELNVCHCPTRFSSSTATNSNSKKRKQVRWGGNNGGLNYTDGVQISRALKKRGIVQGGNLACAVKECDEKDPNHQCWYDIVEYIAFEGLYL
ncbi:hypothetical protein JCM3765_003918 [Sporobolomyces pararoseus]